MMRSPPYRRSDFHFELPPELIAQHPPSVRGESRLLDLTVATPVDRHFSELVELLQPGDLLILNDTRVIPARLRGEKASGGKVEVLVERIMAEGRVVAHIRASKAPRNGVRLRLGGGREAEVVGREGALFHLQFDSNHTPLEWLERVGEIPLPPYIDRLPQQQDEARYQTVYARHQGAVAAPTAGRCGHADPPRWRRNLSTTTERGDCRPPDASGVVSGELGALYSGGTLPNSGRASGGSGHYGSPSTGECRG